MDMIPLTHTAIGNANSLLVSVDSRTRHIHVKFINNPGDYKIKLQEILAFYAKYKKVTKAIRFDRGSEFLSQSSRDFITSKDILIEPSTNYDHHGSEGNWEKVSGKIFSVRQ